MCQRQSKFSCPPITFPSNKNSLMKQSDSREKLFDSSLKTVNVSVNTELSMSCSFNSKKEVNDYFHFYGDGDDDVFHKVISVDNLAYSTSYNDEDDDNGERHAGLKPCECKQLFTGFCRVGTFYQFPCFAYGFLVFSFRGVRFCLGEYL